MLCTLTKPDGTVAFGMVIQDALVISGLDLAYSDFELEQTTRAVYRVLGAGAAINYNGFQFSAPTRVK